MSPLGAIKRMPVFGNKNTFGISCILPKEPATGEQVLIRCHFLVAGEFVGFENEVDLLGTCAGDLERSYINIRNLQAAGSEPVFAGLSDIEAMEFVRKANQLEEEFDATFIHLPQQPEDFWYTHQLYLAESTDKVEVTICNHQGMLKVLKQPFFNGPHEIKSVLCDFNDVAKSFLECLHFLKNAYPDRLSWLQL